MFLYIWRMSGQTIKGPSLLLLSPSLPLLEYKVTWTSLGILYIQTLQLVKDSHYHDPQVNSVYLSKLPVPQFQDGNNHAHFSG